VDPLAEKVHSSVSLEAPLYAKREFTLIILLAMGGSPLGVGSDIGG
jgi:hypothetical protein